MCYLVANCLDVTSRITSNYLHLANIPHNLCLMSKQDLPPQKNPSSGGQWQGGPCTSPKQHHLLCHCQSTLALSIILFVTCSGGLK